MKAFSILHRNTTHDGYCLGMSDRQDYSRVGKLANYDKFGNLVVMDGLLVAEQDGKPVLRIGADGLVPVEGFPPLSSGVFTPAEVGFVHHPLKVVAQYNRDDRHALVLLLREGRYKSNARTYYNGGAHALFERKVEGHKSSWQEGLIVLPPGGKINVTTKNVTLNNRWETHLCVLWDGTELKVGDPDDVDPPSQWTLEGAKVL